MNKVALYLVSCVLYLVSCILYLGCCVLRCVHQSPSLNAFFETTVGSVETERGELKSGSLVEGVVGVPVVVACGWCWPQLDFRPFGRTGRHAVLLVASAGEATHARLCVCALGVIAALQPWPNKRREPHVCFPVFTRVIVQCWWVYGGGWGWMGVGGLCQWLCVGGL